MPVTVYTSSPINAAKASGPTPQTAHSGGSGNSVQTSTAATTTSAVSQGGYPAAQPGARPSLPVQTGAPEAASNFAAPTPTQALTGSDPPAPQPGAVPVPPRAASKSPIPPPPKAGETLGRGAGGATASAMPPQMSYPVPGNSPYAPERGSFTSTALGPQNGAAPIPRSLQESGPDGNLSHPPGYQQDTHASELSSYQRAAHEAAVSQPATSFDQRGGFEDEGLWSTAKKWVSAAGDGLAAAENEVWKRINKD
jgi:hypothetical protein